MIYLAKQINANQVKFKETNPRHTLYRINNKAKVYIESYEEQIKFFVDSIHNKTKCNLDSVKNICELFCIIMIDTIVMINLLKGH